MSSATPSPSPLKQVERGELRPKVLVLYDQLFTDTPKDENYWNEFFLLRCNTAALSATIQKLTPEQLIEQKHVTREVFSQAVEHLHSKDLAVVENTLLVLTIFLQNVYDKPFVNYSSGVIDVLVGLDTVDKKFGQLLKAFSLIIREAPPLMVRVSAIRTATVAAGGAYQTSLASYFTNKDMFAAIITFIHTPGTNLYVGDAFSLIGLLASFDKLESHNPYRMRLADFVDDSTMLRIVQATGHTWKICLNKYNLIKQDQSSSSLSLAWMFGRQEDQTAAATDVEPHATISLMLATFEFLNVNRIFARLFVEGQVPVEENNEQQPALCLYITLCSWLFQTQHKSQRARTYSRIALMVLRILVEESGAVTGMLVDQDHAAPTPISQQWSSSLPQVKAPRVLMCGVMDALQCALRFNTKRTMDFEMYNFALTTTFQCIAYLRTAKHRLEYHWVELWKTMLSMLNFMASHPNEAKSEGATAAAEQVAMVLAVCLIHGDTILPDTKQYDDLFYKIIGASDSLDKFARIYFGKRASPAMGVLQAACNHYKALLEQNKTSRGFSPQQVTQVIKQGYQTLSLHQYASSANGGGHANGKGGAPLGSTAEQTAYLLYDPMPQFKEADERLFFKQATKTVIGDVQKLYACV